MNNRVVIRSLVTPEGCLVAMDDGAIVWRPTHGTRTQIKLDAIATVLLALKGPTGCYDITAIGDSNGGITLLSLPRLEEIEKFSIGGGIVQETGTLDDSDVTTDTIILESASNFTEETLDIILETKGVDFFVGNGVTRVFKLNNTSTLTDTLTLYLDGVKTEQTAVNGDSV